MRSMQFAASLIACTSALAAAANAQSTDVQALRADTQTAAAAAPSTADSCIQGLDRPIVDAPRLIARCTSYIGAANSSPGEQGAAHLARAAAWRYVGDEQKARADDQEAVRLYTSVIDTSAPYPEFVFRRATAYHALGDVKNALRDYDKAIFANPWNVTAFADRGLLLSRYENQYNLALADFSQALSLSPDNVAILTLRGDTYAAQGKLAAAFVDLDRAVTLSPRTAEVYVHRAAAFTRQGTVDKALKDYEQALAIDSDNVDALISRSALQSVSGNAAAAISDLDLALKIRPNDSTALYNRGYAHFVARNYQAALLDYSAAIDVSPDLGMAYANRCLNAALIGREKATTLADCDHAEKLLPASADLRETRGFVELKYADNTAALDHYDQALKLEDNRPLALYGRGIARVRTGDTAGGTADKQAARKLYPNVDREFAPFGVE
jgi:tetratricopeptide (TPR) repeat protein